MSGQRGFDLRGPAIVDLDFAADASDFQRLLVGFEFGPAALHIRMLLAITFANCSWLALSDFSLASKCLCRLCNFASKRR